MGKTIAFANQKGGVGKTTTCVNVSAYLATKGKKVLIVDLDPQGNATSAVGVDKSGGLKSVYNVITGENYVEEVIIKTCVDGLDILPSEINLAGAEIELVSMDNREKVLKNIINRLKNFYDYICIDCPPSLGLLTVNALTACDSVLIPIQCHFFALEGLTQLMNTVKLVKKHLNSNIDVEGVVLTMKDNRSNHVNQVSDEIRRFFNKKVFNTVIPNNIRLAEAPSYGLPICKYDPKSKGAKAYSDLAEEILERNNQR
ncbi:MAG: ParA family protein [Christensenellales bacterium]